MCSITGVVSINPTINYQWFKTAPRRIQVGKNSPILTFDTLVLSDAGQYSCEVTVSSSLLSQAATVVSRDYNLRFPSKSIVRILMQSLFIIYKLIIPKYTHTFSYTALNIQLRLNGIPDCSQYTLLDPTEKTNAVTARLVQGVESLCGCGFSTAFISNTFLKCFDGSPNHLTYRAVLTETDLTTAVELVSYIEQWDANTHSLVVQSVQLGINTTCPVVIADILDSPECPAPTDGEITGFIVGGAIVGVLFVLLIATVVVILVVLVSVRKQRKTGSLDVHTTTAK